MQPNTPSTAALLLLRTGTTWPPFQPPSDASPHPEQSLALTGRLSELTPSTVSTPGVSTGREHSERRYDLGNTCQNPAFVAYQEKQSSASTSLLRCDIIDSKQRALPSVGATGI